MSTTTSVRDKLLEKYGTATSSTGSSSNSSNKSSSQSSKNSNLSSGGVRDKLIEKYGNRGDDPNSPSKTDEQKNRVTSWLEKYSKVTKGISDYTKNRKDAYTEDVSGGFGTQIEELLKEYEEIKDDFKVQLPNSYGYYKELKELSDSISKGNDFMSQFAGEEEYNSYVARQKDYEEKRNLDTDAYDRATRILEQTLKEYDSLSRWEQDAKGRERLEKIRQQYGSMEDLGHMIDDRNTYLQEAKLIQEKEAGRERFDAVRESADFDDFKGFDSGNTEIGYRYINADENGRADLEQKYGQYAEEFGYHAYDSLDDQEKEVYNYLMNTGDRQGAADYLKYLQESLNYRKAQENFQAFEDQQALEYAFGMAAGLDQFRSSIQGLGNMVSGRDGYVPASYQQQLSGMIREDLEDTGWRTPDWMGGASLGQMAYDAITTSANMAPSILTSIGLSFINPALGKVGGAALMGMSAAGGAYQEAINLGFDKDQARGYGVLVGASESVLGAVLGGISKLGGNALGQTLVDNLGVADTAFKMVARQLGGSLLSEFGEEYLQEVLTPVFENLALGTHKDVKLISPEAIYSGILGALTAVVMEGPGSISESKGISRTGQQLQEAGISEARLAELGKTFSADTVAYQLAGKVSENTDAFTIGRLFNVMGANLSEQNRNDIANALVNEGMNPDIARKHAEIMGYIVDGGELSEVQMKMIQKNDVLSKVMREVLIDENSTVNQRMKGYTEAAEALNGNQRGSFIPKAQEADSSQKVEEKPTDMGNNKPTTEDEQETDTEGKTIQISTGKPVEIQEVASIKDGKMMLKLTDGRTVNADDVNYGTESEALVYEAVKEMGATAQAANVFVKGFKAVQEDGVTASAYAHGLSDAYRYGKLGVPLNTVKDNPFLKTLNPGQQDYAWRQGRKAAGKKAALNEAKVRRPKGATASGKGGVYFTGRDGRVADWDSRMKNVVLKDTQESAMQTMKVLSNALGLKFYVHESYRDKNGKLVIRDSNGKERSANGFYDPSDGSIHIDLNAGVDGQGTMLFTMSHEMTHFVRQWSPSKYQKLANFLVAEFSEKYGGETVDQLVHGKMKDTGLEYDDAFEEVVADAMETMLTDGNLVEKLAKLKKQDKSIWQKIKDFIDNWAAKIREAYEGLSPDSTEGRMVAEMVDSIDQLQQLFAEGLVEASENYKASLTPGEDGTVVNADGEPVAVAASDRSVMLSLRTYEEDGRDVLRRYLQKCVKQNTMTKEEMQEMMDGIEGIYQICKNFKDQYAPFSSWSDAEVIRDTRGRPVFSVVTPNGDYKMNLDFSLVCKKRRTLDAVFNEMSRRGIIDDFELGQKSVVKINEIIRKYGLETACALCFVDAKRFRQASMADSFVSLYNELVESLVPEDQKGTIDHFNFSGYATIKKVEGGIDTWDNAKLDFSHINHVLNTYGSGTVEYKAAKYIKNNPKGRKLLLRGDFMSSQGFDAVKTQNQDILKLYNSKKGTGGPKAAFGDVQYLNEIVRKARTWTPEKAYAVGGVRIQSFSDYVPRMVFDYTQMIYDLAARKLPAHAYTKEVLFAKQFGLTGVKINLSLIPAVAEGGIAPGLDANGDYVWAGESFDYEEAKEIQNAEGYTENCGTICVGVSDRHIRKLLGDPNIRMVIPYHKSGLNPIVAHMNKIAEFTDYTNKQNTTVKNTGAKADKHFDFNDALHKMGDNADPRAVIQQYFDWCDDNGYDPKFPEFRDHPNYYKLIEDFTLYDKDGRYVPQREVMAVFPKADSAFGSMKELIREGLQEDAVVEGKRDKSLSAIVDEIQRTIPKTDAEIADEQVAQADRDLEAEVKYSSGLLEYSVRDTESVSNRSLLANALESATVNDIERKRLQEYKAKIEEVQAAEEKLRELNLLLNAEQDQKRLKEIRLEAQQTANRITIFDKQLLRLEATKPLQDVLKREQKAAYDRGVQKGKKALEEYRVRAEKKQQETIQRHQESRKRSLDNRKKTEMRQKIRKVIRDLDKFLNRGDKKRNVKEGLKGFVSEALSSAEILFTDSFSNEDMLRNGVGTDLTSQEQKLLEEARSILDEISNLPAGYEGYLNRQNQESKLRSKLDYRMSKLKDVFLRERERLNRTKVSTVLGNLADAYGRLQGDEEAYVQGAYHENVHEYLKMLKEDIGGTIVRDMTLDQLEELYKAYTMVMTTVRNANRMFAENMKQTRDATAKQVMAEVKKAGGVHLLRLKATEWINSFDWNNYKPVYAFERIGSETMKTLYGNIRKGQDNWAVDIQEANDFRQKLWQKYGYGKWDRKKTYRFTSSSGIDFDLNLEQIMSLYAYSKREQAHDHLLKGGFVFDGNTEMVVNKKGLKLTYLNKNATAYNLSYEILEEIISKLTPEQKQFVDEMQDYLSVTMGEKGNEVSMQLYGVKLFNEQNYFPLRSAGQYMERAKEADLKKEQGQVNIANSGFSKAVKAKANNPVVLSGFMDVWAGHVNEMSMYHSFVLPMEDFRRVYNYSTPHAEGHQSASVNGVIQNAYGSAATDYIDQLYRDLNGGALTDNRTGPINKLMGLFKKGAVFASASVTIQQPSAIARATALVDVKYFIGPKVDAKRHKALWAEVKKYAPVAVIKEMGYFDTNMGRSATDFLTTEEYSGLNEKAKALVTDEKYRDELLSRAPALADELTWCSIWEAVKRETKAKHPKMDGKSEAFLKIAGDRFSEVIDKTQVYDSVLARSANMRSKDTGMKMATAFMAEPTTSINMVADALLKAKRGDKKSGRKAIGSVVASVILNSFLVSFVYAARDDDEDETYGEKYISSFLSGIKDGVNPATYIPFVKDIVSIIQGYDVERSDMAVISDLWNAYKQLERDDVSAWKKVEGFAGSICQIFGVPVKNIMRDVRSAYQTFDTIVNGEKGTTRGTAYAIVEGITGEKDSNAEQLYKARKAGDKEHASRVEARYAKNAENAEEAEKSANAAVRSVITGKYMDGEITLAEATMELTQYAGMKPDEAYWLMDGWKYKKETGSDEGYNKYNALYDAVQTGKDLTSVIKTYTDNGVDQKTLTGQITDHFKEQYVNMSASERAGLKGHLVNAYEQCGMTREKAADKLKDWDFEANYGFAYSDRKQAYLDGNVTAAVLKNVLISEGGYSAEDAEYQIEAYEWEKQGIPGATTAAIRNYQQYCKGVGVSREIYMKIRDFSNDTENDTDPKTGKKIAYSAMKKIMAEINNQPVTNEQKDALARSMGWKESNIKKYKLW